MQKNFALKKRAAWLPDFALFAELPKRKNAHVLVQSEVSKKVFKDVYVRVLIFSSLPNGPHKFYTTNGSFFGVI